MRTVTFASLIIVSGALTACTTTAPVADVALVETAVGALEVPDVEPIQTTRLAPTIAHELLAREHEIMVEVGVEDADALHTQSVAALDAFLDEATARVDSLPEGSQPGDVFHAIQMTFSSQRYALQVPTLLLTDALTTGNYDCDTGSLLFLSVAQRADLPLELVEVPEHNFVRWSSGAVSLNWDINDATSYTDARYIDGWYVKRHTEPDSDPTYGGYMVPHTRDHIDGYHDFLLGLYAARAGRRGLEEELLRSSIALRPGVGKSLAGLAWLYASHEDFAAEEYQKKALEYGRAAYDRLPGDEFFQKVYSCALATNGLFAEAAEFERAHGASEWRLERYADNRDCR